MNNLSTLTSRSVPEVAKRCDAATTISRNSIIKNKVGLAPPAEDPAPPTGREETVDRR